MKQKLITIFGGSGFVGTQLVQELAQMGHRIRVAVRRPDLAQHLRPLGAVGQIALVQANVRNKPSLARAIEGADAVVNLAAIGHEHGRQRFMAVNITAARDIAASAKAAGVTTLVHMSVLGADPHSESAAARSRAAGEAEVRAHFDGAIIIRPSVIFGVGDTFFNRLGGLSRISPVLPVIGASSRFQPVHVGDVAKALAIATNGGARAGTIYEFGGPEIETMLELTQRLIHETGHKNLALPVPAVVGRIMGFFFQLLPNPLLTIDQAIQLQSDNLVSDAARKDKRTLAAFGITPTSMESILPTYLWRFRKHGQFDKSVPAQLMPGDR